MVIVREAKVAPIVEVIIQVKVRVVRIVGVDNGRVGHDGAASALRSQGTNWRGEPAFHTGSHRLTPLSSVSSTGILLPTQ